MRAEPLLGTASVVQGFVLVEMPGPWGRDALRDARMPGGVREQLLDASRRGAKVLLIRRHGRPQKGLRRKVFVAVAGARAGSLGSSLETADLDTIDDLRDLDLTAVGQGRRPGWTRLAEPLVCVCTHGRHDACCAELGRPLAAALTRSHSSLVWEVSHVGGDRFAGNLVILPEGLYYGRVSPVDGPRLVDGYLDGHLDLDLLRGRSSLPVPAQAAEILLRRRLGETRRDAVRVLGVTRDKGVFTVDLQVGADAWRCVVAIDASDAAQLTCGVSRIVRAPTFTPLDVCRVT
jgi:hypothetical protein